MAFPFLTIFIAFVIALAIRFAYLDKKQNKKIEGFWSLEEAAKHAPPKDLNTLPYIKVPIDSFPFGEWDDDEIISLEDSLSEVAGKRILNLTGITNTELRIEYGYDNLDVMSEIGENFNKLIVLLTDYGKALMEKGDFENAARVFEYGAAIKSDISSNYTLLGDCYVTLGTPSKIQPLKEQVKNYHLLMESKIISYLDELTSNMESFKL